MIPGGVSSGEEQSIGHRAFRACIGIGAGLARGVSRVVMLVLTRAIFLRVRIPVQHQHGVVTIELKPISRCSHVFTDRK